MDRAEYAKTQAGELRELRNQVKDLKTHIFSLELQLHAERGEHYGGPCPSCANPWYTKVGACVTCEESDRRWKHDHSSQQDVALQDRENDLEEERLKIEERGTDGD
jgi:hypothetical protein